MSFFTSSNSKPSFFGLGQQSSASNLVPEKEPARQNENYFSFGKFSFSSFANTLVSTEPGEKEDEEKMDISDHPSKEEEENLQEDEGSPVPHTNKADEEICIDESPPVILENPVEVHATTERKVGEDGFCVPVGEPKKVRFSTPKLLKVPLKLLSPSASRQSPKPFTNSPEPTCDQEREKHSEINPTSYVNSTPIASFSENQSCPTHYAHEEKTFKTYTEPGTCASDFLETTKIDTKSKLAKYESPLPQSEESCEVLVDKIIQIEKLLEDGKRLTNEVQDKVDTSFATLIEQNYRLVGKVC